MISIIITVIVTAGVIIIYLYLYNKKERENENRSEVQEPKQTIPVKHSFLERPLIYEKPRKKQQTYISEKNKDNGWNEYLLENISYIEVSQIKGKYYLKAKIKGFYEKPKEIRQSDFEKYNVSKDEEFAKRLVLKYYEEEIKQHHFEKDNVSRRIYIDEQLEMVQLTPLPFSDKGHLKNFTNYLMRSDYAQKWTNKETEKCLMLFPSKPDKFYTMGNLENRKKAARILYNDIVDKSTKDLSYLAMRVTELHNNKGDGVTVDDEEDRKFLMKAYIRSVSHENIEYEPVCFIEHSDGNNRPYHIHEILRFKKSI